MRNNSNKVLNESVQDQINEYLNKAKEEKPNEYSTIRKLIEVYKISGFPERIEQFYIDKYLFSAVIKDSFASAYSEKISPENSSIPQTDKKQLEGFLNEYRCIGYFKLFYLHTDVNSLTEKQKEHFNIIKNNIGTINNEIIQKIMETDQPDGRIKSIITSVCSNKFRYSEEQRKVKSLIDGYILSYQNKIMKLQDSITLMENESNSHEKLRKDTELDKSKATLELLKKQKPVANIISKIYEVIGYPSDIEQFYLDVYLAAEIPNFQESYAKNNCNEKEPLESFLNTIKGRAYFKAKYPEADESKLSQKHRSAFANIKDGLAELDSSTVGNIKSNGGNTGFEPLKVKEAITEALNERFSITEIGRATSGNPEVVVGAEKVGLGIEEQPLKTDKNFADE